jgi:Glycosyl hydrolase family 20, domain 2
MDPVRFLVPAPKQVKKLKGPAVPTDLGIVLKKIDTWDLFFDPARDLGPHGYVLAVRQDGIEATATTDHGVFYASRTFEQLARSNEVPAMHTPHSPCRIEIDSNPVGDRGANAGVLERQSSPRLRLPVQSQQHRGKQQETAERQGKRDASRDRNDSAKRKR